ncbi:MAG: Ig-like domain-containing protein [Candidatus Pacebacteria bacterium]|nr:Ig-like domain-containing protein [Candidatus Paceibacterota bacterium]
MSSCRVIRSFFFLTLLLVAVVPRAEAALTLTSGSNATTTPNVATSITGFQVVGDNASTTPVKLYTTNGTLSMTTTTGLTFDGSSSGSVIYFSGTVANINNALSTLKYTRASTGTDTLEVSLVNRGEVFYTENNHLYKFISNSLTWTAAKTAAEGQTAYGVSGYLATIADSAENAFVAARLTADGWFGASDSGSEGVWKWVTGPENGTTFWNGASGGSVVVGQYANWNSGEPNDSGSNEDCAQYYSASGKWNDLPCTGMTLSGYVVEYGTAGNLPTVVAANISIVTADVPAVTSLSPTNGATSVSPSANLVVGFSKAVSKNTGTIEIRKYDDDSVIESIDASGSQVAASATTTVTIDPSVTLPEGTQLYVVVPSTAFRDASENNFDGISSKTTWAFTVADITAPIISSVATSSIATTTASVTWTTDEIASTKIVYSANNSFASTTSETDTSPRVTSHSRTLSNLLGCTTYNYKVVSGDASSNYATSTSAMFTTLGCNGGAVPTSATTTPITVSAQGSTTLTDTGRTLGVTTPANFTNASTSVVIQIRAQNAETVLGSIGKPASLTSAASVVFDVTALIDNITTLDSFDTPVTITYTYTDTDIVGLDESTLVMHHYHDDVWEALDDCSVNESENTISCTTPSFSTFAIFGEPASPSVNGLGFSTVQSQVRTLIRMGKVREAQALMARWPKLFTTATPVISGTIQGTPSSTHSVRDLTLGMSGEDVKSLQKLLNTLGFTLAVSGAGSPGNETDYFGVLTRNALAKYQASKEVAPSVGYFGPLTRASMKQESTDGVWW